jgi:hypothetical protein
MLAKARDFLFSETVKTSSVAHTAFYSISSGVVPQVKSPGYEVDNTPSYTTKVKKKCSYTSTPPTSLRGADMGFTFMFVTYWMQMSVELAWVNLEEQDEDAGLAKMQHYNQSSPVMQGKWHFSFVTKSWNIVHFMFLISSHTHINELMEELNSYDNYHFDKTSHIAYRMQ